MEKKAGRNNTDRGFKKKKECSTLWTRSGKYKANGYEPNPSVYCIQTHAIDVPAKHEFHMVSRRSSHHITGHMLDSGVDHVPFSKAPEKSVC